MDLDITVCVFARRSISQVADFVREISATLTARNASHEFMILACPRDEEERAALAAFGAQHAGLDSIRIYRMPDAGTLEKASCLKKVASSIRGEWILTVETGGRLSGLDIERLLSKAAEGYDMVNGIRDWTNEPVLNRWQSSFFNWVTRLITGTKLRDLNSTLKVFKRSVFSGVPLYGDFYRFLPVLAERSGFAVADLPVSRREGQTRSTFYGLPSYVGRFLDVLNLFFLTRFTEKPLRFFGGLGMICLMAGIVINGVLTVQRLLFSEGMADRPMLLFGILLIVAGIQSIALGLLGEMIIYARSKDFSDSDIKETILAEYVKSD